jgi:hypothetical protein
MIFEKHTEPGDIILHADITGAPFTIVKSGGREVTPLAIREAGEFAAAYSSAWKAGLGGVDVYWAKPEDVTKTPRAGESLPKGAFIFHKRNFMKKMELKVSVGIIFEDDKEGKRYAKPICGSVQAVNNTAKYFVTLKPGGIPQQELAGQIKKKIILKAMPDDRAMIQEVALEEFQRLIPSGDGLVIG